MLLYFFGSKEQLISEALAQIRFRKQADFVRAMGGAGRAPRAAFARVERLVLSQDRKILEVLLWSGVTPVKWTAEGLRLTPLSIGSFRS